MRKLKYTSLIVGLACIMMASCGRRNIPSKSAEVKKLPPKVTPDRARPGHEQYVKKATIIDSNQVGQLGKLPNQQYNNHGKVITDSYGQPLDSANTAAINDDNSTASNYLAEPVVVIDSRGNLMIDTLNLPPTVSHNLDSLNQAIRAFTPDQAKNLAFRFKQIPPRVLYVPDNLAKKGRKGYYYKYNDKFWYWKKDDGYFYLDENYYK
ncbi:hypothetical protein SAMN05192529_10354 [Arachidicoccus rhizosphaerae]|uniref:Lipoprotein n=1 Tax=Arachidicoccus rhizosphaerae TaxID=551991 RepID=A0A1H3WIB3_9BACT|nr:hypothetical protein [Arachidicoccus rhizosphaerae]SDZ86896.1 hypothetical protein SAMN05192529_10354 [Arachidicoccus rhizosphaerae]